MNALLRKLQSRKITVKLVGSDLSIDAPEGAMTDDLLAEIRKHKAELVSTLQSPTPAKSPPKSASSFHEDQKRNEPIPIKDLSRDELVICIRELESELGSPREIDGLSSVVSLIGVISRGEPPAVIDEYWGMMDLQVWLKKLEAHQRAGKPVQIRLTPEERKYFSVSPIKAEGI
jgi:hypothetical protein